MNATQLIAEFEKYVDDTTELSSVDELILLNKVYHKICDERVWEFLKKEASGTMPTTTTVTVPSDFAFFVENRNLTDNSQYSDFNSKPVGILINGTKWLQIVDWSTRRQYANQDGYAYFDAGLNQIVTTYAQPSGATYSFDYKRVPSDLVAGGSPTSPIFPERFHPALYHLMAIDDMIIQLFDKARSYAGENRAMYADYFARMCMWDANLQNM